MNVAPGSEIMLYTVRSASNECQSFAVQDGFQRPERYAARTAFTEAVC